MKGFLPLQSEGCMELHAHAASMSWRRGTIDDLLLLQHEGSLFRWSLSWNWFRSASYGPLSGHTSHFPKRRSSTVIKGQDYLVINIYIYIYVSDLGCIPLHCFACEKLQTHHCLFCYPMPITAIGFRIPRKCHEIPSLVMMHPSNGSRACQLFCFVFRLTPRCSSSSVEGGGPWHGKMGGEDAGNRSLSLFRVQNDPPLPKADAAVLI